MSDRNGGSSGHAEIPNGGPKKSRPSWRGALGRAERSEMRPTVRRETAMRVHCIRVAGVLAILVLVWGVVHLISDTPRLLPDSVDGVRGMPSNLDESRGSGVANRRIEDVSRRRVVAGSGIELRVLDSAGGPVSGASCSIVSSRRRFYARDELGGVSHTTDEGVVSYGKRDESVLAGAFVLVVKHGFKSALVAGDTLLEKREHSVSLDIGEGLRLIVQDGQGRPLGGVSLAVSKLALPDTALDPSLELHPGADPDTAVLRGTSDRRGYLEFDGMASGVYALRVLSPGLVVLDGLDGAGLIEVPSTDTVLTLGRIWLCCGVVPDGQVLTYIPDDREVPSIPRSGRLNTLLRRVSHRVRRSFGADIVYSTIPNAEMGSVPDRVEFACLVPGYGWRNVSLELVPMTEHVIPETIEVGGRAEEDLGLLKINIEDASGHSLKGERFFLTGAAPGGGSAVFSITSDVEYELPAGSYGVRVPPGASWRGIQGNNVEVSPGQLSVAVLQYAGKRARCSFSVLDGDSSPVSFAVLTFVVDGKSRSVGSGRTRDISVTLPVGVVRVKAWAYGAPIVEREVEVLPGDGKAQHFEILIRG